MSAPGRGRDHQRFCQVEGWTEVRNARGRSVGHHLTFELALPDGRVLRTRISRPPNGDTYGPRLWGAILGEQLQVTEEEFWRCVSERTVPAREGVVRVPDDALPLWLVDQLLRDVGLGEAEVARMTVSQAEEALHAHWSRRRD